MLLSTFNLGDEMAIVELKNLTKKYGTTSGNAVLDINLKTSDGEFVVLVGPSGCGKSTTMRMIAGLEEITSGDILVDGESIKNVSARFRDVAMVFQNYALYPHMTIRENMGFGLKMHKVERSSIGKKVEDVAKMLGLESLLERKPRELSGGQRQRVALGRAIVRSPKVFLMDEPLSNLDAKLRVNMRAEIIKIQRALGVTTFYVTHDQVEAMTMGQRVVVMRDGAIEQIGTPREVFNAPKTRFVAEFIGTPTMNIITADVEEDGRTIKGVGYTFAIKERWQKMLHAFRGKKIDLGIRPEYMAWRSVGAEGEGKVEGVVELIELLGSSMLVQIRNGATQWRALLSSSDEIVVGDQVTLTCDCENISLFDPQTGMALA